MSIIGDFTIPTEAFALEDALSTSPEVMVEADRLASHSPREVFPFLWVTGGEVEGFQEALEEDSAISTASIAEEADDDVLYRVEWKQAFRDLVHKMVDHHAAILDATAQHDQWQLRLRFAEEAMISEFQRHFRERGHPFSVQGLAQPTNSRQREYRLTEEQYDALVTAVRAGYFQVPRATSAEEVGETLDVSANAVSQRLRRGVDTLVRNALVISDEQSDSQ